MSEYQINQVVVLETPDNPRLNQAIALITGLEEWGAHVVTEASATGRYRAGWNEMTPVMPMGLAPHTFPQNQSPSQVTVNLSIGAGYTGDICMSCGSTRMTRSGTCLKCEDCGDTSGCG